MEKKKKEKVLHLIHFFLHFCEYHYLVSASIPGETVLVKDIGLALMRERYPVVFVSFCSGASGGKPCAVNLTRWT